MEVAEGGKVNFVVVRQVRHGRRGIQAKSFPSQLGAGISHAFNYQCLQAEYNSQSFWLVELNLNV